MSESNQHQPQQTDPHVEQLNLRNQELLKRSLNLQGKSNALQQQVTRQAKVMADIYGKIALSEDIAGPSS